MTKEDLMRMSSSDYVVNRILLYLKSKESDVRVCALHTFV